MVTIKNELAVAIWKLDKNQVMIAKSKYFDRLMGMDTYRMVSIRESSKIKASAKS
jgi:hypothetical protein